MCEPAATGAALQQGRRNASVVARSPMSLIVMTARHLRRLAEAIPQLGDTVRAAASQHLLAQAD